MSSHRMRATVLTMLEGDEQLFEQLCSEGLLPREETSLSVEHLELARVAYTVLRELEVNWAGLEIVLRMRAELIASRRQVSELLALLQETRVKRGASG